MAELLHPEPLNVRVERVRLAELGLLDVNARYMSYEQFQRLVENLRRDGTLTSVPFAWWDGERYLVLSGNHRVKAAMEADIDEAFVMLCDDPMPVDRRVALQLAHNAITGQDDVGTLRQLYEGLEDVDWRQYAGLDDKTLDLLSDVSFGSLTEASLDFQIVSLTFLPDERERAEAAWSKAKDEIGTADAVWVAERSDHGRTLDALDAAGRSYSVGNVATCFQLMLDIFERHVRDLRDGFLDADGNARREKQMVPTVSIVGHEIPAGIAALVDRALNRIMKREDLTDPAQALERLAGDYLAALEDE